VGRKECRLEVSYQAWSLKEGVEGGAAKICDASSTALEVVSVASRKKSVAIPAEDATVLRCSLPTLYPTDASRSHPAPAGVTLERLPSPLQRKKVNLLRLPAGILSM
jgi:hypothetical protein